MSNSEKGGMTKEEITLYVARDVLDFVHEMVKKRRFASASHGFELMAYEYMTRVQAEEETAVAKLERFTLTGLSKTADLVRDTADRVQESSVAKAAKESADKVMDSSVVRAVKGSTDKVMESSLVKGVKESVDKSTTRVKESSLVKDVKETRVVTTMQKSAAKVRDAVAPEESRDHVKLKKEKREETI